MAGRGAGGPAARCAARQLRRVAIIISTIIMRANRQHSASLCRGATAWRGRAPTRHGEQRKCAWLCAGCLHHGPPSERDLRAASFDRRSWDGCARRVGASPANYRCLQYIRAPARRARVAHGTGRRLVPAHPQHCLADTSIPLLPARRWLPSAFWLSAATPPALADTSVCPAASRQPGCRVEVLVTFL